jgi:hypothetical protein
LKVVLADETAAAALATIEETYVANAGIDVKAPNVSAAPTFLQENSGNIEVVGAAFNAAQGETVELKVTTPAAAEVETALATVDITQYDIANMIPLEINLEVAGVEQQGTLK